jgi:hypothetical protein
MDLNSLRLDTDAMLNRLRRWVECESPTFDALAVSRMVTPAPRSPMPGAASPAS